MGWKKRVTRSMVGCDGCGKRISIVSDYRDESGAVVIVEQSKESRTYYEKGKKRLCPECFDKLPDGEKGCCAVEYPRHPPRD